VTAAAGSIGRQRHGLIPERSGDLHGSAFHWPRAIQNVYEDRPVFCL
jgi:hypothetical protein